MTCSIFRHVAVSLAGTQVLASFAAVSQAPSMFRQVVNGESVQKQKVEWWVTGSDSLPARSLWRAWANSPTCLTHPASRML